MNTLVLNLSTLAATEYDTPYTSLAGDFEATDAGVYRVGGDDDAGTPVASRVDFSLALTEKQRQRKALYLYLHGTDLSETQCVVTTGKGETFTYSTPDTQSRVARFVLGRGIRDNFLKYSLRTQGGKAYAVENLEFEFAASANRRM